MSDDKPTGASRGSGTVTVRRPAARPKGKPRYGDTDHPADGPSRPATRRAPTAEPAVAKPAVAEPAVAGPEATVTTEPAPPAASTSDDPFETSGDAAPTPPKAGTEPSRESKATVAAEPVKRTSALAYWAKRPLSVYLALVVAAAIFAGYALVAWVTTDDGPVKFARARDAVLLDARQDIVILNKLDYRNVDAGLRAWQDATTGDLHSQLTNVSPDDKKSIVTAKKVSTGKVIDAAVTELDNRAGTATVIATVETTVTPNDGTPPKRNRFTATMTRVGKTWKLSDLAQVGVNLS